MCMENKIFSKIYMWLFIGLLITFGTGYYISTSASAVNFLFSGSLYYLIFIAEVVIAIFLGVRINKMQKTTSMILYVLYTVLTGLTFASLFLLFNIGSIIYIFLVTSLLFLILALIGRFTSLDLTKFGTFLFMGLIGVIILEIINIFLASSSLNMGLLIIGLIIFICYIAYDIQKIKRMNEYGMDEDKLAIIGAFNLYLDFINIFIRLLELFGKNRD